MYVIASSKSFSGTWHLPTVEPTSEMDKHFTLCGKVFNGETLAFKPETNFTRLCGSCDRVSRARAFLDVR